MAAAGIEQELLDLAANGGAGRSDMIRDVELIARGVATALREIAEIRCDISELRDAIKDGDEDLARRVATLSTRIDEIAEPTR